MDLFDEIDFSKEIVEERELEFFLKEAAREIWAKNEQKDLYKKPFLNDDVNNVILSKD